jgi:hypothetical protein
MNNTPTSTDLYGVACNEFFFLLTLGFQVNIGIDKAEFVSLTHKFVIHKDRYGELPTYELCSSTGDRKLTSPVAALQYYLDDYLQDWSAQEAIYSELPDAPRSIKILVALLKHNNWIFTTSQCFDDANFTHAVEETNDWFRTSLSDGVMPTHAQSVAHLRAWRPSSVH